MIRIRYKHWLFRYPPLNRYRGICLGRFILFKQSETEIDPRLLRHEMAHQHQITRDGMFCFYFVYLRDYVFNLLKTREHWAAYREIPYEVEARRAEEETAGQAD